MLKDKVAAAFCRFLPSKDKDRVKTSVSRKIEEKMGFCNVIGEETENLRNFFISNNKVANLYYKLWMAKKINRLPLIVLTSFRLLLVAFFIVTVVHQFLTENPKVILLMLIASIVLLFQSKWLFDQYMKIENQFLSNLNGQKGQKEEPPLNQTEKSRS